MKDTTMNEVYLLTGGNMGDREAFLEKAAKAIEEKCGTVLTRSSIYETAAWGKQDQEPFLNQVLKIRTGLEPRQLLKTLLRIEEKLGRKREIKYGPRLIDIDILFFGAEIICEHHLVIPHPEMQNRRFVLEPLAEIAPGIIHPVMNKTIQRLLAECTDPLAVNKIS
ncbi:MAG TPA: 2-amino-4-hydroxy-6-hydroxymethyldihydropteridine diphosphokinase [Flavisolibacter sp.]